jgi:hypothetical protein
MEKIKMNLIEHYLNDSSYTDPKFNELIIDYYDEIKNESQLNISEYLQPLIGPLNIITEPVYRNVSDKYLRKTKHRKPKLTAIYELIYGDNDQQNNNR